MDVVILIAFIAAVSGAWWRLTEHAKAAGTGWYLRNVFAGTVAILIGGLGAGLMSEGGFVSLFGVAIVIYAASSPWMRVEGNKVRWEARLWRPEDTQAPHAVSNIDAAVERPLNQETDRIRRESLAAGAGMRVVKTVTVDLMYLCMGPNAGPSKIDKANEVGAALIDEAQFLSLI